MHRRYKLRRDVKQTPNFLNLYLCMIVGRSSCTSFMKLSIIHWQHETMAGGSWKPSDKFFGYVAILWQAADQQAVCRGCQYALKNIQDGCYKATAIGQKLNMNFCQRALKNVKTCNRVAPRTGATFLEFLLETFKNFC